jgi:hypothetical protein
MCRDKFRKAHRNVHVVGGEWRVWKSVLLQRLPRASKNAGFVIEVKPQNTTICPDRRNE